MKKFKDYIVHETRLFFIAIWFLTRLPNPAWVGFKEEWLQTCIKYSPYVGWLLGTMGFVLFAFLHFFFGSLIAFICFLGFLIIITGCFHEDGFADFCDGIGGGWKSEDILRIMKDSRIGSFGAAGLGLLLLLKVAGGFESLRPLDFIFGFKNGITPFFDHWEVLLHIWLFFVTAHSFSRWLSLSFLVTDSYAKEDGYTKPMATSLSIGSFLFATIGGLLPLGVLTFISPIFVLIWIPVILTRLYFARLMKKWIGGYTGDCLGAVQQATETIVWVWGIFLWKSF
jgi:adenosylcobinamide-GDP ribazoletransferase